MTVGSRIARWRAAKGMTRKTLARRVGVTVAAVYQWEGEGGYQTKPHLDHLEKAVRALGITMEQFYGELPLERAS